MWISAIPLRLNRSDWLFISILAFALGVRLLGVMARPLWYDEAFSILFARQGPAAMVLGTFGTGAAGAAEEHPLLYYLFLWVWMLVFGETPAVVRLFSIIFGLAIVWLVFRLSTDLFGEETAESSKRSPAPPVALLSAALVALAPFQIYYAQEVRMYAQLAALIVAAAWALWRGMHSRGWGWWGLFALIAALAQYTHSLAFIYLLVLALTPLLARRWHAVKAVAIAGLVALLLYLPWLVRLPEQLAKVQGDYWIQRPGISRIFSALLSYVTNLPLPAGWLPVALFITLFAVLLAGWQTYRMWRQTRKHEQNIPASVRDFYRGAWLAYLAFAPLGLLFLVSQIQPVFIERALLPAGVFFWMWVGWSLSRTGLPRPVSLAATLLLLVGMGLGLFQHLTYQGFPYAPYPQMSAWLDSELLPGDVIVHSNKLSMLPMVYYSSDQTQHFIADLPGSGADTLAPVTQRMFGLLADNSIASAGC